MSRDESAQQSLQGADAGRVTPNHGLGRMAYLSGLFDKTVKVPSKWPINYV